MKVLSGRKRESAVWSYFMYEAETNKSSCIVGGVSDGELCGKLVSGKNTTNLFNHLKCHHPSTYREACAAEGDRKRSKPVEEKSTWTIVKTGEISGAIKSLNSTVPISVLCDIF